MVARLRPAMWMLMLAILVPTGRAMRYPCPEGHPRDDAGPCRRCGWTFSTRIANTVVGNADQLAATEEVMRVAIDPAVVRAEIAYTLRQPTPSDDGLEGPPSDDDDDDDEEEERMSSGATVPSPATETPPPPPSLAAVNGTSPPLSHIDAVGTLRLAPSWTNDDAGEGDDDGADEDIAHEFARAALAMAHGGVRAALALAGAEARRIHIRVDGGRFEVRGAEGSSPIDVALFAEGRSKHTYRRYLRAGRVLRAAVAALLAGEDPRCARAVRLATMIVRGTRGGVTGIARMDADGVTQRLGGLAPQQRAVFLRGGASLADVEHTRAPQPPSSTVSSGSSSSSSSSESSSSSSSNVSAAPVTAALAAVAATRADDEEGEHGVRKTKRPRKNGGEDNGKGPR